MKHHTSTQTIANIHTQTQPIIDKAETSDFMCQTINNNETQTINQLNTSNSQTQTISSLNSNNTHVQTNPITYTVHTQTQPIMCGVSADTSDLFPLSMPTISTQLPTLPIPASPTLTPPILSTLPELVPPVVLQSSGIFIFIFILFI